MEAVFMEEQKLSTMFTSKSSHLCMWKKDYTQHQVSIPTHFLSRYREVKTRNQHDPLGGGGMKDTTTDHNYTHIKYDGVEQVCTYQAHTEDMCILVSLSRTRKLCAHDVVLSMCQKEKCVRREGKERKEPWEGGTQGGK